MTAKIIDVILGSLPDRIQKPPFNMRHDLLLQKLRIAHKLSFR